MTFLNPVIPGFHPDPSACRVGDDYYLVTSTFTYFPGVPIFHSKNLIDWVQIGNVLDRRGQLDLSLTKTWSSFGIFAPTIRFHDGRFWMITTNVEEGMSNTFFVTTTDPAGAWSDPIRVNVPGADPDLAWDGARNCWVHFSGAHGIARCRINDTTGEVLENPTPTWSGTGLQYPEAPHLYQRGDVWYLLMSEGGTRSGHSVSIARGPSPAGPWEGCPANPILSHRSTDRPIQNTGHADLVDAADGSSWLLLLGVRPKGISPGFHVLGRETFLVPVEWVDGWPIVGELKLEMNQRPPGPNEPVTLSGRDYFDSPSLHPRWMAIRRPPEEVASLNARPGWLTLSGTDASMDSLEPVFVGRRQQHQRCRFKACVDAGTSTEADLAVYMDENSHYRISVTPERVVAQVRIGPADVVVGEAERASGSVVLAIETGPHIHGPDCVRLGTEDPQGTLRILAELDGRYLSTEVTGGFTGRIMGCTR
ncbi:MAG: glycoside hydrolase family 43 protein [Acidimicrobiales bacterium]